MRKVFVFALAVVMVMAMAVPAFAAVSSPAAKPEDMLPVVVAPKADGTKDATPKAGGTMATVEDAEKLPEEAKKTFEAAQTELAKAAPEGMATKFFFYFTPAAEKKGDVEPGTLVVRIPNVAKVVIKQFVDGKWVELKFDLAKDGTITLKDLAEGPIAIFTK